MYAYLSAYTHNVKANRSFPQMTHSLGTALVTGASSGIGAVYADRLAKRGYDLILVARNGEKLKSLSARLTSETGRSVKVIPADLGDKAALAKIEAVLRDDPSITVLVNNAGTASLAPLLDSDVDQMEAMITLNVTALTRLTYAAAPAFVARGAGTIINIGSVVGIVPERLNGVYGAGQATALAFSPSVRHAVARLRRQTTASRSPREGPINAEYATGRSSGDVTFCGDCGTRANGDRRLWRNLEGHAGAGPWRRRDPRGRRAGRPQA